MVDFHTHILPFMDDGSQSIGESLTLLRMLNAQGVHALVASPHYYAEENTPEEFLEKRDWVWRRFEPYLWPELPEIHMGAEVQYFEGICAVEDLSLLRIEGSDLLLVEMPFCRWTDRMIEDVLELNERSDVQIVLAHIERYMDKQPKEIWQYLRDCGVLMQSNVSFFTNWKTRHRAMSMLAKGEIHMLGSDCHNKTHRPPNWDLLPEKAWYLAQNCDWYLNYEKEVQRI